MISQPPKTKAPYPCLPGWPWTTPNPNVQSSVKTGRTLRKPCKPHWRLRNLWRNIFAAQSRWEFFSDWGFRNLKKLKKWFVEEMRQNQREDNTKMVGSKWMASQLIHINDHKCIYVYMYICITTLGEGEIFWIAKHGTSPTPLGRLS